MRDSILVAALLAGSAVAGGAHAAPAIYWTDWTSVDPVSGSIAAPAGTIGVTFAGAYSFVQTGTGFPYWSFGNYNGDYNQPPAIDIVGLVTGGAKTISFDKAVVDPYLALMSWNTNTVSFSAPFTVVSNGRGYWGSGTPILNGNSTGFFGAGEVHAILQFHGTFTSLSFTDTFENWHGFTVGVADVAPGVPEPAAWALMIAGFGMVGFAARRRRTVAA
jgi:hypothetical protein